MKSFALTMFILCGISAFTGFSYAGGAGTTGADFLKLGAGAKPHAMGNTFTGMDDDINCMYWNPAGLSNLADIQGSFSYAMLYQNIYYGSLCGGKKIDALNGFLGGGVTFVGMDAMKGYDTSGNTAGDYTSNDINIFVSYATNLGRRYSLGGTLNMISESIAGVSSGGIAVNIGALWHTAFNDEKLTAGAVLQNAGTGIGFNEKFNLPLNLKLGIKYAIQENWYTVSDIGLVNFDKNISIGAEYLYLDKYVFRGGFRTASMNDLGFVSALSLGFGAKLEKYAIDYAFVPYGGLGSTHRISIGIRLD